MTEFSHDWQLFSLRACWKHCRAALHVEMKGSLKRTFTSARFPFFSSPALGTVYKWKWSKLKGFNWCISISQVCWDWYGRLKDSVNIESVPLEKVTAQPSDCRCRMPKLEGHWDNQEALWKDGLTLSSRRNNTSCRLRAQLCSYFWRITTPKGQNPTWPVCSVSSLLMRYIRKNLQRKEKTSKLVFRHPAHDVDNAERLNGSTAVQLKQRVTRGTVSFDERGSWGFSRSDI